MMLQCARRDVATGFISGNLAQDTVHSQGKEGKFAFALQSQELFKCQGVNFTDRITMQLHPRFDGEEKSLSREDGRSVVGWNAVHPCFILTRISKKFLALWTKEGEL